MLSADLVTQLSTTLEQLIRRLRSISTAGGISPTAAATMRTLDAVDGMRITDLAESERISQPAMTQLLRRMEGDGLVQRQTLDADRRATLVSLTSFGRSVLRSRQQQRRAALSELLAELRDADRAAIEAALPALQRLAEIPLAETSVPHHHTKAAHH